MIDKNEEIIHSLLIPPNSNGRYAFLAKKISGDDCLEVEDTLEITQQEALEIYEGVRLDFLEE